MFRSCLVLAALCLVPSVASAQLKGPFEVELSASGINGSKFNGFSGALNVGLGYFITPDQLEIGVRQSLQYTDIGTPRTLNGSTRVAADFHFPLGDQNQFLPFVGANLGYVYGDSVSDTWELAPEGGIKVFVGSEAFVYAQVEYQFFFRSGSNFNGGFKNGQFVYSAGVGFRF
ncbi:MAG TPA: outer membrane beta-barrel protein [Tepidisphaeraceae bacterium]|jgi:outer membrane protein W